jgi:hypothetical protein
MEGEVAGGMAVSMTFWLLTNAVLWIVPLWFLLPRAGMNRYLSLIGAIPLGGTIMLWILALKRWPGE